MVRRGGRRERGVDGKERGRRERGVDRKEGEEGRQEGG